MASMHLILSTMVAAELKISQIYGREKELQLELPDFNKKFDFNKN